MMQKDLGLPSRKRFPIPLQLHHGNAADFVWQPAMDLRVDLLSLQLELLYLPRMLWLPSENEPNAVTPPFLHLRKPAIQNASYHS
jgi:hypothetical protein